MGYLTLPKRDYGDSIYTGAKFKHKYVQNNYSNKEAVNNVIRDITRSRVDEQFEYQLVGYGAYGLAVVPDLMIQQMNYVQKVNDIERRKGNRIFHEIFRFTPLEVKQLYYDYRRMIKFAYECAELYYGSGHQVAFAIHCQMNENLNSGTSPYHIHFAVNSINYIIGNKFHSFKGKQKEREKIFNNYSAKYLSPLPYNLMCPIEVMG